MIRLVGGATVGVEVGQVNFVTFSVSHRGALSWLTSLKNKVTVSFFFDPFKKTTQEALSPF